MTRSRPARSCWRQVASATTPAKLAAHFPSAAATGSAWYIGAEGSRGDALDLGAQVEAQTIGHDRGLRLLHAGFAPIYEAYLPGWLILVNADGRRFGDETAPYGIMDNLIRQQGDRAFAICDRATLEAATDAGIARYKQAIPGSSKRQSPHWTTDIVDQMVREGRVHTAETIDGLAESLGLPVREFAGTVARYNRGVAAHEDDEFAKDAKFLEPIATPPFYGVEIRPATVCFTAYGLRIDRDARVLDRASNPITGSLRRRRVHRRCGRGSVRRERELVRQHHRLRPDRRCLGGAARRGRSRRDGAGELATPVMTPRDRSWPIWPRAFR